MSFIGATEGIDIYNAASEDGRSITAALKFTIPYIGKPQSEWPYQQIKEWDKKQDEACWVPAKPLSSTRKPDMKRSVPNIAPLLLPAV